MTDQELAQLLGEMQSGSPLPDNFGGGLMQDSPEMPADMLRNQGPVSPLSKYFFANKRPTSIGLPPDQDGDKLRSFIRGFGEGRIPGTMRNIVTPIVAGVGTLESKLRGDPDSLGNIYTQLSNLVNSENKQIAQENKGTSAGGELLGTVLPGSVFNKLFGVGGNVGGSINGATDLVARAGIYGGKGALAGAGTQVLKKFKDLINPDTQIGAVKDVVKSAVTTGGLSAALGPVGDMLVKQTAAPSGAEDFLKQVASYINGDTPMPKQVFEDLMGQYKDIPAVSKYLRRFATNQAAESLFKTPEEFGSMTSGAVKKAAVNLPSDEKVVFKLLNRLNTGQRTVGEIQDIKSGDLVKDASNVIQRNISDAAKKDILKAIFNATKDPKATKAMNGAYTDYSAMKTLQDVLKTNPAGNYLNVESTLKNLNNQDLLPLGMIEKFAKSGKFDLGKFRDLLTEYSNAGVKDIKFPNVAGKTLRGALAGKSIVGLQNDVASSLIKELMLQLLTGTGKALPKASVLPTITNK